MKHGSEVWKERTYQSQPWSVEVWKAKKLIKSQFWTLKGTEDIITSQIWNVKKEKVDESQSWSEKRINTLVFIFPAGQALFRSVLHHRQSPAVDGRLLRLQLPKLPPDGRLRSPFQVLHASAPVDRRVCWAWRRRFRHSHHLRGQVPGRSRVCPPQERRFSPVWSVNRVPLITLPVNVSRRSTKKYDKGLFSLSVLPFCFSSEYHLSFLVWNLLVDGMLDENLL